jgi:hypothetical protein
MAYYYSAANTSQSAHRQNLLTFHSSSSVVTSASTSVELKKWSAGFVVTTLISYSGFYRTIERLLNRDFGFCVMPQNIFYSYLS